ncbi:MAG: BatA domain-containing protein [Verrucomicrobiales bacterium]
MPLVFANPAGFWALLGIPAILLIHFLQRQSRSLPVSTLFLLERVERQSLRGRKLDRLRHSVPLWIQLLCVLILTWLLAEPRWLRGDSVHPVVVVVDSSASMEAFHEQATEKIAGEIKGLVIRDGQIVLSAMESHPGGDILYRGDSADELAAALADWRPFSSKHSPEEALRVGRSVAGSEGTLVYLTDHPEPSPPFGAKLFSVGEPIDNVGFAGLTVDTSGDEPVWRATVRNHASTEQIRDWSAAVNERRTDPRSIVLAPGETRTLSGSFPEGTNRIRLALEPDRFTRDDHLYVVIPKPKPLVVANAAAAGAEELATEIVDSLENVQAASDGETPDLALATYNPLQPTVPPTTSIVFLHQEAVPNEFFDGPLVAANHPIVRDLNWQGLIARSTPSVPAADEDVPLLWQGERPLIVLRETNALRQLIFNFDVAHSNAAHLPAFIVLVHRFVGRVRDRKIGPVAANTDLRQALSPAFDQTEGAPELTLVAGDGRRTIPLDRARFLRAPGNPGFFRVAQGDRILFDGAANFSDTREADFSSAASFSDLRNLPEAVVRKQTRPDPWWQAWIVAVLGLLLVCWAVEGRKVTI